MGREAVTVSVVIPTWNRASTIVRAIESVLRQTTAVQEVLVCDDGSDDDTFDLVSRLIQRDSRIRWVPGERAGRPALPRNRGVRYSSSDWVAFLDSDDEWLPEKLARQLDAAEKQNCLAACSNAYRVLPDGSEQGLLLSWTKPRLNLRELLRTNWVICSSSMVRRSLLDVAGGFPEGAEFRAIEDYALWLRISTLTDFAYCQEALVRYCDAPATSIRSSQEYSPACQRRVVFNNALSWLLGAKPYKLGALLEIARASFQQRYAR